MIKRDQEARKKTPHLPSGEAVEGVLYQTLATGETMMITAMSYGEDAAVPHHSHPHEQAGYIVSGIIVLDVESNQTTLGAGDSYVIPGDSRHSVTAKERTLVVDVFSPPREDYRDE
jgi:quercetin dioxygenase-like cupin family protein